MADIVLPLVTALFAYLLAVDKRVNKNLRAENSDLRKELYDLREREARREKEHLEVLQTNANLRGTLKAIEEAELRKRRPRT